MFTRLLPGLFLTLMLSLGAHADAPVWKVSMGENYFFVGGTIHVLQAQDYPLPDEFEQAYEIAEKLVFEVDIKQVNSTLFQQKLLKAALYTDGSTAWSHNAKDDERMVKAMRAGRKMTMEGTSSRGTDTRDTYSLSGFTAAHNSINKACRSK